MHFGAKLLETAVIVRRVSPKTFLYQLEVLHLLHPSVLSASIVTDYDRSRVSRSMSRYLTPSKVGLLALISLYTDSVVATASTIPILSFIVSHILPLNTSNAQTGGRQVDRKVVISVNDFQNATITHASGIPGRTVWDLLLKRLWEINSFDALHMFFDNMSFLLVKTREEQQKDAENGVPPAIDRMLLSRTSPLGVFVRRAQLEFTRLQFHDTMILWKSYIAYREPTLNMWRKRNAAAGKTSFDVNLHGNGLGWQDELTEVLYGDLQENGGEEGSVSTDDVERLLEFQVDGMQSMLVKEGPCG